MRKIKIVADSASDVLKLNDLSFAAAPLKIVTSEKEFIDNEALDAEAMVVYFDSYKGKSSTSCPNPADWITAFGDAEDVFCVTITSGLSGSYNSAMVAKKMYESENADRRVYVIDSLSAGPELKLIIEKLKEYVDAETDYNEICRKIEEYKKNTGLLFMLKSMKNLANNGRVSKFSAKLAEILKIHAVGRASNKGDLEPLNKCRGELNALSKIVYHLKAAGLNEGKVRIAHCLNESAAFNLKNMIENEFKKAKVEIYKCRGLCSFYAEKGGLLVGFEKM